MTKRKTILIAGSTKLSFSTAICLRQAGYAVSILTNDVALAEMHLGKHANDMASLGQGSVAVEDFKVADDLAFLPKAELAIAFADEKLEEKKFIIAQLEKHLVFDVLIAINTESIGLNEIQLGTTNPRRVIGLNWVEPSHTTFFLEFIISDANDKAEVEALALEAKAYWNKDPYIVQNTLSIRTRLFSAMAREAFYLIENGYATVQDIDRACRNDAGYYLPFAGNFRYMDLMGTHSYAEVMKKLNADLATDQHAPKLLKNILDSGGLGMENNKGFYAYENGDTKDWEKLFSNFSYKIQEIIERYPFNYDDKQPITDN